MILTVLDEEGGGMRRKAGPGGRRDKEEGGRGGRRDEEGGRTRRRKEGQGGGSESPVPVSHFSQVLIILLFYFDLHWPEEKEEEEIFLSGFLILRFRFQSRFYHRRKWFYYGELKCIFDDYFHLWYYDGIQYGGDRWLEIDIPERDQIYRWDQRWADPFRFATCWIAVVIGWVIDWLIDCLIDWSVTSLFDPNFNSNQEFLEKESFSQRLMKARAFPSSSVRSRKGLEVSRLCSDSKVGGVKTKQLLKTEGQ